MTRDTERATMIVPLVVACAFFMENFDGTVITTALPDIARSFGSNPVELSLAITGYVVSLAVFIPISGWLADRFGARAIFRTAIIVFTVASILCGISQNLAELAGSRILQGIGGAMMIPIGRLVVLRSVPKSEFVRAMSYVTVPALIGPVLGPPVGGFLATYASWRWIFYLNVPIGILGVICATIFISEDRAQEKVPLDWAGFLLVGAAAGCLMTDLDLIVRSGMAEGRLLLVLLAVGSLFAVAAFAHSRRRRNPLLDLTLLRIPTFAASVSGGTLFRIAMGAFPFVLPLLFQVGFGITAFGSGLLTFSAAIGAMSMKASAPPILRRFGFRAVLMLNGLLSAGSILACSLFDATTPLSVIFVVVLAGGFMRSLQFASLNAIAYADVPQPRMSAATTLAGTIQQYSVGAGVALSALVMEFSASIRGGDVTSLSASDMRVTFVVIGLICLASALPFVRLAADAGYELSGHGNRTPEKPKAETR